MINGLHFVPESTRSGGGHHWCNGRGAVGATGVVSARILVTRWGCVGAVLVRRQIFLDAGRILPLWKRDDTVRCGHYWWNRRDVVGASRPISARILGTQTGCGGAVDGTFFEAATFGTRWRKQAAAWLVGCPSYGRCKWASLCVAQGGLQGWFFPR